MSSASQSAAEAAEAALREPDDANAGGAGVRAARGQLPALLEEAAREAAAGAVKVAPRPAAGRMYGT
jgi:hypothetical protein